MVGTGTTSTHTDGARSANQRERPRGTDERSGGVNVRILSLDVTAGWR